MNKTTIIWLSIVSVVLLIVVTVLLTLGVTREGMVRGGLRGAEIKTEQIGKCPCCQNKIGEVQGKGERKNTIAQGEGAIVKDTTTLTPVVPAK